MNTKLSIKDKSDNSLFMKASAFRKNTRKTEPHKHNSYFEIIYLSAGKGYHFIDNKTYEVHPPVLFFVRKEQVHHWDLTADPEPEGFVVILKKTFFEQSLDGELKSLLLQPGLSASIAMKKMIHSNEYPGTDFIRYAKRKD